MADFSKAWPGLIDVEGGYVNDPQDPGGETKFGISKRSYPLLEIRELTLPQALDIYLEDFWNPNRLSEVKDQFLADEIFEMIVNTSPRSVWQCVQRSINRCGGGVYVDGRVGNFTLGWLRGEAVNDKWLLDSFRVNAALHYAQLPNNSKYLRGWILRVLK